MFAASIVAACLSFTTPAFPRALYSRTVAPSMVWVDGVVVAGITVMAAEAFSDKANAFVVKKYVTAPVATDAISLATRMDAASASSRAEVDVKARRAFENMSPKEVKAREASADEVFARATAVLAAGLCVAAPSERFEHMMGDDDDSEEAVALRSAVAAKKRAKFTL